LAFLAGSQALSKKESRFPGSISKKAGFPSIRRENVRQGWPRKEQREGEIKEYSFLIFQSHQATKNKQFNFKPKTNITKINM